jgi:hypothetical protein
VRLTLSSVETEGNLTVTVGEEAVVGNGDPKDVRGQRLQGATAMADGLTMDDPILPPDSRRHLCKQIGMA